MKPSTDWREVKEERIGCKGCRFWYTRNFPSGMIECKCLAGYGHRLNVNCYVGEGVILVEEEQSDGIQAARV